MYAKGLACSRGAFQKKLFLWQKQSFKPIFLNRYLSNEKSICEYSMAEPTILSMEINIFFLGTFLWPFYGQFFIKTVRGPFRYSLRIRGFRKFCLRVSNSDNVFFYPFFIFTNNSAHQCQIALRADYHRPASETPFKYLNGVSLVGR